MEEKEIQNELASIRSIMERSSKFISLSGLSGILAGVYALIGADIVYHLIYGLYPDLNPYQPLSTVDLQNNVSTTGHGDYFFAISFTDLILKLLLIAILVILSSLLTGLFLTRRKAKLKGQPIWSSASRALLFQMSIPIITGGILILVFIYDRYYDIIAPTSLIFYGLALIGASSYTFTDVKYLGICEILLGLVAACLPGFGLLFWAIGFGLLHIVYGSMMYFKYDR